MEILHRKVVVHQADPGRAQGKPLKTPFLRATKKKFRGPSHGEDGKGGNRTGTFGGLGRGGGLLPEHGSGPINGRLGWVGKTLILSSRPAGGGKRGRS